MRRFLWAGFLVFVGCASAKQGGFLESYASLGSGKYLEKVSISPDLAAMKSSPIEVEFPKLLDASASEIFPGDAAQELLKNSLKDHLRSTSDFSVTSASDRGALKLETAITKFDPGSRAMRWFASELGGGHSLVQVEGRLIDSASGKVLLQFADRRAGSASGGLDITGGDPVDMMKSDLDNIAKSVAETLRTV